MKTRRVFLASKANARMRSISAIVVIVALLLSAAVLPPPSVVLSQSVISLDPNPGMALPKVNLGDSLTFTIRMSFPEKAITALAKLSWEGSASFQGIENLGDGGTIESIEKGSNARLFLWNFGREGRSGADVPIGRMTLKVDTYGEVKLNFTEIAAFNGKGVNVISDPNALFSYSITLNSLGDVSESYWAGASIRNLYDQKIIGGFPDGSFRPEESLTRAQIAKMMVLWRGLQATEGGASPFPDVPADHWASGFIATAVQQGFVNGFPDGTYRPEDQVTKAQLVKLLVAAKKWTPILLPPNPPTFPDTAENWVFAQGWLEAAVQQGVIKTLANGEAPQMLNGSSFAPDSPATRAQSCVLMDRCSGIPDGTGTPTPTPTPTITPSEVVGFPGIEISPESVTLQLPDETTQLFTVTVRDGNGKVIPSTEVRIVIESEKPGITVFLDKEEVKEDADGKAVPIVRQTDPQGQVKFELSCQFETHVDIKISVPSVLGSLSQLAECKWTKAEIVPKSITITPTSQSKKINERVNFRVLVRDQFDNLYMKQIRGSLGTTFGNLDTASFTTVAGKASFYITSSEAGVATITAIAGSLFAKVTCAWENFPLKSITLQPKTASAPFAGGTGNQSFTVICMGTDDKALSGVELTVTVSPSGTVNPLKPATGSDGRASFDVTVSEQGKVTIKAEASGKQDTATCDFQPTDRQPKTLMPKADSTTPSVGSQVTVAVTVLDQYGDPMTGKTVTVTPTGVGNISPGAADTDGKGIATFTATSDSPGESTFQFACEGAKGTILIEWKE